MDRDLSIDEVKRSCQLAFTRRLREALYELDWDIKKLADEIGVSYVSVSRYLHGLRMPSVERLVVICAVTRHSMDWYIGSALLEASGASCFDLEDISGECDGEAN